VKYGLLLWRNTEYKFLMTILDLEGWSMWGIYDITIEEIRDLHGSPRGVKSLGLRWLGIYWGWRINECKHNFGRETFGIGHSKDQQWDGRIIIRWELEEQIMRGGGGGLKWLRTCFYGFGLVVLNLWVLLNVY